MPIMQMALLLQRVASLKKYAMNQKNNSPKGDP
jgi:hypothetical protein